MKYIGKTNWDNRKSIPVYSPREYILFCKTCNEDLWLGPMNGVSTIGKRLKKWRVRNLNKTKILVGVREYEKRFTDFIMTHSSPHELEVK